MNAVCVFCGSSPGTKTIYGEVAAATGREIARRGWLLVYGGGNVGLMAKVADAALGAGGKVVGVIPRSLLARELGHQGLTELVVVNTMHERKARMADLSDGFLALPGGFGTFEEFCEVLTWSQLGLHTKPCGLVNVDGYYDPLLALFDRAVNERFTRPEHRALVLSDRSVTGALNQLETWTPVMVDKWIDGELR
jgi:uncharacterized protein (TIGR00730 family)